MARKHNAATASEPRPCWIASPAPRSSQTVDIRSTVIARMTIGNRATDSPVSSSSRWLMMLTPTISSTTMVSTALRRAIDNSRRRSR